MSDYTGIYRIDGAVLTAVNTTSGFEPDINVNASGGITNVLPAQATLVTNGNEVVCHNAVPGGLEAIETFVSGVTTYPVAWNELYYSKQNRLSHVTIRKVPTMYDVYRNIPDCAPSASAVVSASYSGAPEYMAQVGTLAVTFESGTGALTSMEIEIDSGLAAQSGFMTDITKALNSGNLIFVDSGMTNFTASVVSAAAIGNSVYVDIPSGYSSRSVDFAVGSTVKILSLSPLSSSVSGVFLHRSYYSPSAISIPVVDSGSIRDLKVWVELVNDCRNVAHIKMTELGLQGLQLAIRSPNTDFYSSHPLWNAPAGKDLPVRTSGSMSYEVPGLLQNSYLLWGGHRSELGVKDSISETSQSLGYHEFDYDMDMRTVFWDGANDRNPRDLTVLFPSATLLNTGDPLSSSSLLSLGYSSPTAGAALLGAPGVTTSLTCSGIPWMLDNRLTTGSAPYPWSSTMTSIPPPPGWLTGQTSEFPTTGSNIGPSSIRPVYPLLDDVTAFKAFDAAQVSNSASITGHGPIRGFRPGLRGSEINGVWNLMVGNQSGSYAGFWLRQVRLEAVIDSGIGLFEFIPSRSRKWAKSSIVPAQDGYQNIGVVSGAGAWDVGLSLLQRNQQPDYGRTVSITDNRSATSYAVISNITGTLADQLAVSGVFDPTWFLKGNGLGTPYIPDSSMSLGNVAADQIDAQASQDLYNATIGQTTTIPSDNTLASYLNRESYSQTTAQIAEAATSGSS